MQDFRKLDVWTKAHELALDIHRTFGKKIKSDDAGIRHEALRAAMAIPTNLAEGCWRSGRDELATSADLAIGSATELEYQLIVAHDTGLIGDEDHARLTESTVNVRKMLFGLTRAMRKPATERVVRVAEPEAVA